MGNNPELSGVRKDFLNRTQALKSTINKWNLMKLKSFCMAKYTIIEHGEVKLVPTRVFTVLSLVQEGAVHATKRET